MKFSSGLIPRAVVLLLVVVLQAELTESCSCIFGYSEIASQYRTKTDAVRLRIISDAAQPSPFDFKYWNAEVLAVWKGTLSVRASNGTDRIKVSSAPNSGLCGVNLVKFQDVVIIGNMVNDILPAFLCGFVKNYAALSCQEKQFLNSRPFGRTLRPCRDTDRCSKVSCPEANTVCEFNPRTCLPEFYRTVDVGPFLAQSQACASCNAATCPCDYSTYCTAVTPAEGLWAPSTAFCVAPPVDPLK